MKRDFIKLAYFVDDRNAALFQARLEEAGIPSFVSNAHANSLIPQLGGGVGIHINKKDLELGKEVLTKFQEMQNNDESVFTHHDATHEDIAYEKEINKPQSFFRKWSVPIVILLIVVVLLRYVAKSQGLLPQFFEPF